MVRKTTYSMKFKRRREGKTDYRTRLALLKSRTDRLVVRVLSRQVVAQVIGYDPKGDVIKISATSEELKKLGWKSSSNAPSSYLTGYLIGLKAKKTGIKNAVLDIGLKTPVLGSNVFAVLKGAIDAGLNIPFSEDSIPEESRYTGKLISDYRKVDLTKDFESTKQKLDKEFK